VEGLEALVEIGDELDNPYLRVELLSAPDALVSEVDEKAGGEEGELVNDNG